MVSLQISVLQPVSSRFFGSLGSKRRSLALKLLGLPISSSSLGRKARLLHSDELRMGNIARKNRLAGAGWEKVRLTMGRTGRLMVVTANQGFDFNGGGGDGGGGWDRNSTSRVLSNLALAIGLTYLTVTGQLGWFLDAIVSIWLLAVLLPIVGIGAFFWFAGRDIVQDTCPNCGNGFQIFRSSLKDGVQFCPFCTQPFSVEGDKFVREPARFSSNRSTKFRDFFNGFSRQSDKGVDSSAKVVDIEAEVKDID